MKVSERVAQDEIDIFLLGGVVPATPIFYTCGTKVDGDKLCGEIVYVKDYSHKHGCPVEGGMCGSPRCNETGSCQA